MKSSPLNAQEIVDHLRTTFGNGIASAVIKERAEGQKKIPSTNVWIVLNLELLKPAIQTLMDIAFPHLAVISGVDIGEEIELLYHFSLFYGSKQGECTVTLKVKVPKNDPRVPTISDLMPSAVFTEREKQEMLGVEVVGIPDPRRLFLPDDFPNGVFPWRKDSTGIPDSMVKNLWEVKRPKDRPAPPIPPKAAAPVCSAECTAPDESTQKTATNEVKDDGRR